MNPGWAAVRAGLQRGRIELKQTFTNADSLIPTVIVTGAFLAVMVLTRKTTVPGTHFSLGATMLTSVLGMSIGVNGLATMGGLMEQELASMGPGMDAPAVVDDAVHVVGSAGSALR